MRAWIRAAMAMTAAAALGCTGDAPDIAIGAAGPWTAGYTQMTRWGLELAIEDANARHLTGAAPVRLSFLDDGGDGAKAVQVAERFSADPAIVAVVGHLNSGAMVAAAQVYDRGLAAISPAASSPEVSGVSSWVFRTIPSDSANGATLGQFATRLGRRTAVLYENDSYGRGLASAFRRHYRGEIVSMDPISTATGDLEPFVTYYTRVVRPDVVFVAGLDGTASAFLHEARRQRLPAAFLGGDGWAGVAADTVAAEGVYIGVPFDPADPRPAARAFVEAFRRRYGRDPDGYAALAYDATMLIVHSVAAVGIDRTRIRDHLATMRERGAYAGVTGAIAFDSSGDPAGRGVVLTQVRQGRLVMVSTP